MCTCRARSFSCSPWGLRVNTVGFGVVETPMTEIIRSEKFRDTYLAQIPLGRAARGGAAGVFPAVRRRLLCDRPAPVGQRWLHHWDVSGP